MSTAEISGISGQSLRNYIRHKLQKKIESVKFFYYPARCTIYNPNFTGKRFKRIKHGPVFVR